LDSKNFNFPVYVISVRSYTDRQKSITNQMNRLGINFEFIFDKDPEKISKHDLTKFNQNRLKIGAISCVLKHINAWKKFAKSDSNLALILEDDIIFKKDFLENLEIILKQISDMHPSFLAFLGGMDNRFDGRFFNNSKISLIKYPISTTEAYIIDKESNFKRLDWVKNNKIEHAADHLIKKIDNELSISQYRVSKPMVFQGSLSGIFYSELDDSRSKHSRVYIFLRFYWGVLRKQYLPRFFYKLKSYLKFK